MGAGERRLGIFHMSVPLLLSACVGAAPKPAAPVFFPPAPAPPRIQYLTSYSGVRDIEQQSAFSRFVVGEIADVRVDKPYGVAMSEGKIYVCDTNGTVMTFDLRRKTFEPLKGATGNGKLTQPVNISIDADGTKYVADPVRGQVVAFDRDDEYLRAYGEPGGWRPVDAVAIEDRLYVADPAHGVVKIFDKQSGEMTSVIGDKGPPAERLDRPTNLAVDRDKNLYVTDIGRFQVVKFDRDGHFEAMFGRLGNSLGHFARPKGIALDRDGRLYAVDAAFNNVQIFNGDGRLLMFFGGGGDEPGTLTLPAKVAIDYDNIEYLAPYVQPGFTLEYLILVTSQFGDRRVNLFGYGRETGREYLSDTQLLQEVEERRKKAAPSAKPQ